MGLRESKRLEIPHAQLPRKYVLQSFIIIFPSCSIQARTILIELLWCKVFFLYFFFYIKLYGRLGDGRLGQSEPSPPLGTALVGANKKEPVFANMQIHRREGGIILC